MSRNSFNLNLAVGAFILAVAALVGGFLFLYGNWEERYFDHVTIRVRFRSISNLRPGSPVKLAGRPIGVVEDLYTSGSSTDGRYHVAVCQISDRAEYRDAIRADSRFAIQTDGVLGDQHVAIGFGTDETEPLENDAFVWGSDPVEIASVLSDLQKTAANAAVVTESLKEGLVGPDGKAAGFREFLDGVRASTENLARITTAIESMLGGSGSGDEPPVTVRDILNDLRRTTYNAQRITEELRLSLAGEGTDAPDLRAILMNLQQTSANTALATESLRSILGSDSSGQPADVRKTLRDIEVSAANLRDITLEIKDILAGLKKLYPGNWFK